MINYDLKWSSLKENEWGLGQGKHQSPSIQAEAQQKHNASRNNRRILYFFKQYQ